MNSSGDIIWIGFLASLFAGLGTGFGALGVFAIRRLSEQLQDSLLSFAAGIMLAASFISLLMPAGEFAQAQYQRAWLSAMVVCSGLLAGGGALYLVHRYAPHEHFVLGREGPDASTLSRMWLFVIAITLHNFPEGMAVGVGFAGGDLDNGRTLAVGILLQNIPEGLAVATSLLVIGYGRLKAFVVAFLTGLVEPVGGLFGSTMVSLAEPMMPWTLGFAAGAMVFIISDEIVPETHRGNHSMLATFSLMVGVAVMISLDILLA
ncbi:MAG: ZIP family metal transporter [Gammaproteobacteria bacterium]|nr:ZIP family metal transporter [Gammaproteobacteria bacterium]MBT8050055.1 ZIP family metal transporter [Gammaproteobacteria bacterium]NNJ78288.1 ZIP family metal transporter [Xanthomonadales bacterium]